MFRFAIAALLAIGLTAPAFSQAADDSQLPQIIIVGDANAAPAIWFNTHPGLSATKSKSHFTVLKPTDQLYKQRYADIISGPVPMVLLQRPDGGVIFAAAGSSVPKTAEALYQEMKYHWELAKNAKTQDCDGDTCPPNYPSNQPGIDLNMPWNRDEISPLDMLPEERTGRVSDAMTWVVIIVGLLIVIVIMGIGTLLMLAVAGVAFKLFSLFGR